VFTRKNLGAWLMIIAALLWVCYAKANWMPDRYKEGSNFIIRKLCPYPTQPPDPNLVTIQKLTYERDTLAYQLEQENTAKISMTKQVSAINTFLVGQLKKKGIVYYRAAHSQETQVSPMLLVAMSLQEVGRGCNSPLLKRTGNVCGMNWTSDSQYDKYGRYVDYSRKGGIDASIWDMAYRVSKYYIANGRCTIASIAQIYAPIDDPDNGKHGMNNNEWAGNVTKYYNAILNEAKNKTMAMGGNNK
jgi:hypothetical protein